MLARRTALNAVPLAQAAHAGAVLDYLLEEYDSEHIKRRELLQAAGTAASNCRPLYEKAFRRWESGLGSAAKARVRTESRLITGLGIETVLETGLRLHHTYGTPLIPGSSLKGLAAHYCAEVWAASGVESGSEYASTGPVYRTLFGEQEDRGFITFHDAWIIPNDLAKALMLDVMTPHYGPYYMGGAVPNDAMKPTPVSFLSVRGVFLVAIECEDTSDAGKQWARLALDLCKQALRHWGAGGKTRAGYGRLVAI